MGWEKSLKKLVKDIMSPKNIVLVLASVAIGWFLHSLLTGTPLLGRTAPPPAVQRVTMMPPGQFRQKPRTPSF